MRKIYLWISLTLLSLNLDAQTFNGGGGAIADAGFFGATETCFDMQVSTGNQMMNSNWGLQQVCITFSHTWVNDLDIALISPTGTGYYLSIGNGGNNNFSGTICFTMTAGGVITSWNGTSSGSFQPEIDLGIFNTGQTSQGIWTLCFYDNVLGDAGSLSSWSLTFGNSPAPPAYYMGQAGTCMINDCGPIDFYDSGGSTYAYANGETYIQTFCTDAPGQCIQVVLNSWDIENNYDFLDVYDGPDETGTYIGFLTGTGTGPITVTSTTGCLTFVFTSDGIINAGGWDATIQCTAGAGCAPYTPPANDDCVNATPLSGAGTNAGAIGCDMDSPDPWGSACGWLSTENSVFYTVNVTGSTPQPVQITLENVSCTGGAAQIQMALFDNNCATVGLYGSNFHGCASGVGNVTLTSSTNPLAPGTYILAVDGNAGADCNWTVTSPVLAVGEINLTALYAPSDMAAKLSWAAENLVNSEGFEIERSADLQNWTAIGEINGLALSSAHANYSFSDRTVAPGMQYHYRIKELDANGHVSYSNIETIYTGGNDVAELISAYPSPATDHFTLEFYLPESEQAHFELLDLAGRKVFELPAGQLGAGYQRLTVPLEGIAQGMYIWRLAAGETFDGRLIVK